MHQETFVTTPTDASSTSSLYPEPYPGPAPRDSKEEAHPAHTVVTHQGVTHRWLVNEIGNFSQACVDLVRFEY